MYHKDQYSSLHYNPTRQRLQRPQTPNAHTNHPIQQQFNQSYTNKPMTYSPHKYTQPNNNNYQRNPNPISNLNPNITKSRISINSSTSQLSFLNTDQGQIFPDDLIFLLKHEQKNINNFKQKIEKQKNRVQNDFAVFKTQIEHILQDLKLSVQAQLDLVYKVFISKYAEIKGQVQQIRRLRKQILMANQVGPISIPTKHNNNNNTYSNININNHNINFNLNKQTSSNFDIMSQIEKDAQHFRNYRVYGYLTQMQKQKINPILQICNELILIGSVDCPFYRSKQMSQKHKQIKSIFAESLASVYQRLKDYVITPEHIVQKQKIEQENNGNILKNIEQESQQSPQYYAQQHNINVNKNQRQAFDAMYPQNRPNHIQTSAWNDKKILVQKQKSFKKSPILQVGRSQKSIVTKYAQTLNLKKLQRIVTDHSDAILCIFFIDNRYIATGSKDKTINVYTIDGVKVTTLRGHDAAICSLSSVQNRNRQVYLASGSDHGCCCLILWDTRTWTISSRIQSHSAAVTSIVDLQDGQYLVTGSYDKKIILYDYSRGQVTSTHSNKSAVTSIVLTSDKKTLVSSGLDYSLLVWHVSRKSNGLTLELGRSIANNSLICVLESSLLNPDLVFGATRDGRIKIFNINSQNQTQKSHIVSQNSIIQLITIQRQMKNDSPLILSCSSKDKNLTLTKMDNGTNQLIKINGNVNIQFGHGIGPKIVVSQNGIMAILSQAINAKEFSLFQVQLR